MEFDPDTPDFIKALTQTPFPFLSTALKLASLNSEKLATPSSELSSHIISNKVLPSVVPKGGLANML